MLLISVGNTRTRFAAAGNGDIEPSRVLVNSDPAALTAALVDAARGAPGEARAGLPVLIASVNRPVADRVRQGLESAGVRVYQCGRDVPIPIQTSLPDPSTIGQDRLLDALGAFWRSKQACIVIDAGTAVTVDFVDGQGVFHGGAIAPGVAMMLAALHEKTSGLPLVTLSPELIPGRGVRPDAHAAHVAARAGEASGGFDHPGPEHPGDPPFGKSTQQAIALGVSASVQGLVRLLIDRYAEFYGAYPRVVATGGDAPLLFQSDPLVEAIVPDLTLVGMLAAVQGIDDFDDAP